MLFGTILLDSQSTDTGPLVYLVNVTVSTSRLSPRALVMIVCICRYSIT